MLETRSSLDDRALVLHGHREPTRRDRESRWSDQFWARAWVQNFEEFIHVITVTNHGWALLPELECTSLSSSVGVESIAEESVQATSSSTINRARACASIVKVEGLVICTHALAWCTRSSAALKNFKCFFPTLATSTSHSITSNYKTEFLNYIKYTKEL